MAKLTVIIPTLNEEHNIKDVLESVAFADEIIVVDSYSTDKTIEKARLCTKYVFQHKFKDFSSQKNWALEQATNEWVLFVDADERISSALKSEIVATINLKTDYVAYSMHRNNYFLGKKVRFSGWQNDKVVRLIKKSKCRYNNKLVHESIDADGEIGLLHNPLLHYTYKNFDHYVNKLNHYSDLQSLESFQKNKKVNFFHFLIKPLFRFIKHYFIKQGFRDGYVGFVIAYLQSYAVFSRYVKLWQLYRTNK